MTAGIGDGQAFPDGLQAQAFRGTFSAELSGVVHLEGQTPTGAAGLYRHLEVMADAGILVRAGQRKAGRRWERIYDLNREAGAPMCDPQSGAGVKDDIKLCSAMMRAAIRDYGRALHARKGVNAAQVPQPKFITSLFEITHLDEASAAEFRSLADRMMELVVNGRKAREGGRPYRISLIASPIV